MRRLIRVVLLLILAICGLVLGYMRWTYLVLFENGHITLVVRNTFSKIYYYPHNYRSLMTSLSQDPRWLSLFFYSISPFLLSIGVIYLTFLKSEYVKKTVVIYILAWSLVLFLSILSLIFPTYAGGIGLAQNIKNLIQMPFLTLLLIAGFKVSEKLETV